MKVTSLPLDGIVRLIRSNAHPHIYDVELARTDTLRQWSSVEFHAVVYPKSRKICAEHIACNPYDEYVSDILSRQRSAYAMIKSGFPEFFGLALGCVIVAFFYAFNPADLFSIESVVSILGAYFLGRDIWDDIERLLVNLTKGLPLRYIENPYSYRLEAHTTLTHYSYAAKRFRYGRETLLPSKMESIRQSNSQTVRMLFGKTAFRRLSEKTAHVLSVHIEPSLAPEFERDGYMFGVKLSFNRRFLFLTNAIEVFQSMMNDEPGCIGRRGEWVKGAVFFRKTTTLGRIKLFRRTGTVSGITIVERWIAA